MQRNSKEKECESPVWKHIYFHHQAIALNKQNKQTKRDSVQSIYFLFGWLVEGLLLNHRHLFHEYWGHLSLFIQQGILLGRSSLR